MTATVSAVLGPGPTATIGLSEIDGPPAWTVQLPDPERSALLANVQRDLQLEQAIATPGDDEVLTTTPRSVVALDARAGEPRWRVATEGAPLVVAGTDTLGVADDASIRLLDLAGGGELVRWTPAGPMDVLAIEPDAGTALLTLGRDLVLVDVVRGRERWRVQLEGSGQLAWGAIGPDLVHTQLGDRIAALRTDGGQRVWTAAVAALAHPPVLAGDHLVVVGADGTARALDPSTGADLWRVDGPFEAGPPAVAGTDTAVLLSRDRHLVALDLATGRRRWTQPADMPGRTRLGAAGPVVAHPSADGARGLDLASGQVRWTVQTATAFPQITAGADTVYVADRAGTIHAVEPATGEIRWRQQHLDGAAAVTHPPPVRAGDHLLTTVTGGPLVAYDATSGEEVWRFEPPSSSTGLVSSPAVAADLALVGSLTSLHGVHVASGRERWTAPTGTRPESQAVVRSGLAVVNVGVSLVAVDTSDQRLWWQWRPRRDATVTPAVVVDDHVLVGAADGTLARLDPATGEPDWELDIGPGVLTAPVVTEGVAVVRSDSGALHAHEAGTGRALWRQDTAAPSVTAPAAADGQVYAVEGTQVVRRDARSGEERWRTDLHELPGTPTVAGDAVYLGTAGGEVLALDASDGSVRWRTQVGDPVTAPVVVGEGAVFVVTGAGRLIALD